MNYWCFGTKFNKISYMYVDLNVNSDYLADSLFYKREMPVQFKDEMVRDGDKYRMIFCKVRKKDKEKFEEAMKELVNKMNLLGHTDYLDYCLDLRKELDEECEKE